MTNSNSAITVKHFCQVAAGVTENLAKEITTKERFSRLIDAFIELFPSDAVALLQLEGDELYPVAVKGFTPDTLGRRFSIEGEPRLARILNQKSPVRFPAESDLPDPYDGLIDLVVGEKLHVHDCMGASLYVDNKLWGVVTLDALTPGTFDDLNMDAFTAFIRLTEASVKVSGLIDYLQEKVNREHAVVQAVISEKSHEIVGQSPVMKVLFSEMQAVANTDLSVLVLGETGVGKELVARFLHEHSLRKKQSLVYVNCAALPESLAESELFGHRKGAFSGAIDDRAGKFELADGGTLFLDEVGELPLLIQAKLLRVLQNGEIQRVGDDKHREVSVRIIAATNRDLKKEVAAGRFRADLYHRLSVYPIFVPPLRDRGQDVLALAGFFLGQQKRRLGVATLRLSERARTSLLSYHWPGNVRELEHLMSRAAVKTVSENKGSDRSITIENLGLESDVVFDKPTSTDIVPNVLPTLMDTSLSLKNAVDEYQRQLIINKLEANNYNKAATARDLDVDRGNFYRLLKRLHISDE